MTLVLDYASVDCSERQKSLRESAMEPYTFENSIRSSGKHEPGSHPEPLLASGVLRSHNQFLAGVFEDLFVTDPRGVERQLY